MTALNALEKEVLDKLLAGEAEWLRILREQVQAMRSCTREFSSTGFFTRFIIPENAPRLVKKPSFRFGDVSADIEGLEFGAGFLLLVKDGCIDMLEGYSYEEAWPREVDTFRVYYSNNKMRNEDELRESLIYASSSSIL